jgi:hypothetical protein
LQKDTDQSKEEVSPEWIHDNYGAHVVEGIKIGTDYSKIKFLEVYPGDAQPISESFVNTKNPPIMYPQEKKRSCVFSSTASVFHHLKEYAMAEFIIQKYEEFQESLTKNFIKEETPSKKKRKRKKKKFLIEGIVPPNERLEWFRYIMYYLQATKTHHHYEACYIDHRFDLMEQYYEMEENEFIIAGLHASDNTRLHVVCICKGFIFDSNVTHALSFSLDALNECCQPSFEFIYAGIYVHKRSTPPFIGA